MSILGSASSGTPVVAAVVVFVVAAVALGIMWLYWRGTKAWRVEQRSRWRQAPAAGRSRAKRIVGVEVAAMIVGFAIGAAVDARHPIFAGIAGAAVGLRAFGAVGAVALGCRARKQNQDASKAR